MSRGGGGLRGRGSLCRPHRLRGWSVARPPASKTQRCRAPSSRSLSSTCPAGIQSSGCRRQDGAAAAAGRRRRLLLLVARAGLVGVFAANRTGAARGAVSLPALHRRTPRRLPCRRIRDRRLPGASAGARLWLLFSLRPLRRGTLRGVHATLRLRVPLLPASRR